MVPFCFYFLFLCNSVITSKTLSFKSGGSWNPGSPNVLCHWQIKRSLSIIPKSCPWGQGPSFWEQNNHTQVIIFIFLKKFYCKGKRRVKNRDRKEWEGREVAEREENISNHWFIFQMSIIARVGLADAGNQGLSTCCLPGVALAGSWIQNKAGSWIQTLWHGMWISQTMSRVLSLSFILKWKTHESCNWKWWQRSYLSAMKYFWMWNGDQCWVCWWSLMLKIHVTVQTDI